MQAFRGGLSSSQFPISSVAHESKIYHGCARGHADHCRPRFPAGTGDCREQRRIVARGGPAYSDRRARWDTEIEARSPLFPLPERNAAVHLPFSQNAPIRCVRSCPTRYPSFICVRSLPPNVRYRYRGRVIPRSRCEYPIRLAMLRWIDGESARPAIRGVDIGLRYPRYNIVQPEKEGQVGRKQRRGSECTSMVPRVEKASLST